ncbi:MAG: ADP-ribose pyrophosphatase [Candidatus Saccharibacteria bacterium]|nr:ADP-ribose pyrophosphatase [Candidatus Saccharibacteria bacterium]
MRLHYFMGRILSPFHTSFFIIYNKLFHTPRARVLVWNENNELLLVRNWAGTQQWGLPGGGVEGKESPINAAKRELYEEIGVKMPFTDFLHVATLHQQYEAWIYTVMIPRVAIPDKPHNPWEITDIRWFSPEDLPADISPLVPLTLKHLSKSD